MRRSAFGAAAVAALVLLSGCETTVDRKFLPKLAETTRAGQGTFSQIATSILFDPLERRLLIGREAGTLEAWALDTPGGFRRWEVQADRVNELAVAGRPGLVFTGSSQSEGSTRLWDARSGRLLDRLPVGQGPTAAAPDPDVQVIAHTSTLHFYDLKRRAMLALSVPCRGVVTSLAVDLRSGRIAAGSASGTLEVWAFSRRGEEVALRPVGAWAPYEVGDWVQALRFSQEGEALHAVTRSGRIDLWDVQRLERLKNVPSRLKHVSSVSFAEGRDVLALAGTLDPVGMEDSRIELLSLTTAASRVYWSDSNMARVQYVPPLQAFVALQFDSVKLLDLEP